MTIPLPNLDDKTFAQLMEEARAAIPRHHRDWTDFNPSDPGITLLELFAWINDTLIYRINRITDETKWRLLALLSPPRGSAAVDIVFTNNSGSGDIVLNIPAGSRVHCGDPGFEINFVCPRDIQNVTIPEGGSYAVRFFNINPAEVAPGDSFILAHTTSGLRNPLIPIEPHPIQAPDVVLGVKPLVHHPQLADPSLANLYMLPDFKPEIDTQGDTSTTWTFVPDLSQSESADNHFSFDYHRRAIVFGDGLRGAIPKAGKSITLRNLRVSDGAAANLPQNQVWTPKFETNGLTLSNPVPTSEGRDWYSGATDTDRLAEAELDSLDFHRSPFELWPGGDSPRLPYFLGQQRAVTRSDFENLPLHVYTPGDSSQILRRVWAVDNFNHADGKPRPNHTTVLLLNDIWNNWEWVWDVDHFEQPAKDESAIAAVKGFLEERRQLCTRLHVGFPSLVRLELDIRVKIHPDLAPTFDLAIADMRRVIMEYFDLFKGFGPVNSKGVRLSDNNNRIYLPDTNTPDDTGRGRRPGRPFYQSEIFALLETLDYVDYVDTVRARYQRITDKIMEIPPDQINLLPNELLVLDQTPDANYLNIVILE